MGAGDEREHFFQDLGESYYVLLCQIFVTSIGLNITSVDERQTEFDNYCLKGVNIFPPDVDPKEKFLESCYAMNATKFHKVFIDELINNYQGCIFDFNDVESDYRNRSLKGDFVITIKKANDHALMNYRQHTENPSAILNDVINSSGGIEGWYNYNPSQMPDDPFTKLISVSLKNYGCDPGSIQLCSGTWHSLINNFVLEEAPGPGNYIDAISGNKFAGQRKIAIRNANYEHLGLSEIIGYLSEIDSILNEIKEKYVVSETTLYWNEEVKKMWQEDCNLMGHKGIDIVIKALKMLPGEQIKKKFLKKTDLCNTEELLVIGSDKMFCSLFNQKYKDLIKRANNDDSKIEFIHHGKNIRMILKDDDGEILHINIPFTLQKNGAWYLPREPYEGTKFHVKENKELKYGERRPKKSREINTSTNMWFSIKNYI
jgi:hypothetical protein